MKKAIPTLLCLLQAALVFGQAPPPPTDIFLVSVSMVDGKYTFGVPENITNREGYDNQPFFLDSNTVFYSSIRDDKQADIYTYFIPTRETTRFTITPEDEFSPGLSPDRKHICVVRVERDSAQRLWQFTLPGDKAELIIPSIRSIGYYSWLNRKEIALYIIGDIPTLHLANMSNRRTQSLAKNIGRSIQCDTASNRIYYVDKEDSLHWYVNENDPIGRSIKLIELPEKAEDFIIGPDGGFWVGHEGKLLHCEKPNPEEGCATRNHWKIIHDFSGTPANRFYRIAFSPDGKKMALVGYSGEKP